MIVKGTAKEMKDSLAHLPEFKRDGSAIGARYDREYKITKGQLEHGNYAEPIRVCKIHKQ